MSDATRTDRRRTRAARPEARAPQPHGGHAARQAATEITAAADVSFDVAARASSSACSGPSGCGKTSILNVLAGLEAAEQRAGLARRTHRSPVRALTGPCCSRSRPCSRGCRCAANIELALELDRRAGGRATRERTNRWLANVHLERWADAQPHELSAGMRQRAALARALAADPDVAAGRRAVRRARRAGSRAAPETRSSASGSSRTVARRSCSSRTTCGRRSLLGRPRVRDVGRARPVARGVPDPRTATARSRRRARVSSRLGDPRTADAGGGRECRARDGSLRSSGRRSPASPGSIAVWAIVAATTSSAAIPSPPWSGTRSSTGCATARSPKQR